MKILAIGDIHGKDIWKQAVKKITADVIVFIGDYVNAKQWIGGTRATSNLKDLIDFKKSNPNSVYLLLGNHDVVFLHNESFVRSTFFPQMSKVYRDNVDCFDIAYAYRHYLFTHAGVSYHWFNKHRSLFHSESPSAICNRLNELYKSKDLKAVLERGRARGGSFPHGGPIYADKSETQYAPFSGIVQIVGHSQVPKAVKYTSADGSVIYVDCLNSRPEFLLIDEDYVRLARIDGELHPLLEVKANSV